MIRVILIIFNIILISCGGGNGGNSSSQSSGEQPDFSKAVMAKPTLENGEKVEEIAAVNQQNQYSLNSVLENNNTNSIFIFHKLTGSFNQFRQINLYALNNVANEACEYGGNFNAHMIGDWGSELTVTLTYNQCTEISGLTLSGTMKMSLSDYNSDDDDYDKIDATYITDVHLDIDDSSLGASSAKILAGSKQEVEFIDRTLFGFELDMKITARQVVNGVQVGMENADVRSKFNVFSSYEMYYRSGRFYIDDLKAYVDYDVSYDMSSTPYIFDNNTGEILSGEAHFLMANGGKAKIVGTGGEPITYVDANGDDIFEIIEN